MADSARVRFTLPRRLRLQQSRDFARARQRGERIAQGCLVANWLKLPQGDSSKVGVITSRKVGAAVVRSRARRLLREAFRLSQHDLKGPVAMVLVARPSIVSKPFDVVVRDYVAALRRGGLLP